MKPLLFAIWAACGSDAATTHVALTHTPGAYEAVVPSQNPWVLDGVVAGEAAAVSWGVVALGRRHPRLARVIGWSVVAGRGAVAVHNLRQLRRTK